MSGLRRFTDPPAGAPAPPATPSATPPLPAPLRRFLVPRPTAEAGQRCELCGVTVPEDDHRHVVDLEGRGMLCSCRGCALLFTEAGAGAGRYRTVPEDLHRLDGFRLTAERWAALDIPVGMAFVVDNSVLGHPVAFYPSPGGATEAELAPTAWDDIVTANPALAALQPDVQACLIRARFGAGSPATAALLGPDLTEPEAYVVPVDRCYELVGLLRLHWRGFDGGQLVRDALATFFADVRAASRPVPAGAGTEVAP